MQRTLLAIRQKSGEPSFWEVMDSFVLFAYASLAVSRTLLQQLLACLNFRVSDRCFKHGGAPQNLMGGGGGLKSKHGGSMGVA